MLTTFRSARLVIDTASFGKNLSRRTNGLSAVLGILAFTLCGASAGWSQAKTATATTLAATSGGGAASTLAAGSVVTLTATVNSGATPVKPGQVNFCDAAAAHCTDVHMLGTAQLTSAGTATLSFRPAIGSHSYKAVFVGTNTYSGSASGAASVTVTGTTGPLSSITTVAETGSYGNYALTATVTESGGTVSPMGSVSFLDTSKGSSVLDSVSLGPSVAGIDWQSPVDLPLPTNSAQGEAVGDFNGDGILDLAVSGGGPNQPLVIFLGSANGTYTSIPGPSIFTYSFAPLVVADFNEDGKQDLAVLNANSSEVTILLGNGDGTFTVAAPSPASGVSPNQIAVGDFNGDGIPDLAVTDDSTNTVLILLGVGDGTFTAVPASPEVGSEPISVAVGDFNGDGNLDLAVTDGFDDTISILLGNGDGTFAAATAVHCDSKGSPIVVADFTGDGKLDLAVGVGGTNGASDSVTILAGNGDGTFNPPTSGTAVSSNFISSVEVGDFNADGIPDLALTDSNTGKFTVFQGNGSGAFTPTIFALAGNPYFGLSSAVGDLNGDGRTDLLVGVSGSNSAFVYFTEPTETATATAKVTMSGVGEHLVEASYAGDSHYNASVSGTIPLWGVPPATTTTLAFTSAGAAVTSVAPGTLITLTATVKSGGNPLTAGQVNFCDASASTCTDIHLLQTVAVSSSGTAVYKFVPGPGVYSYKAVYVESGYGLSSSSSAMPLTVGPAPSPVYSDTTAIAFSGQPGDYSLTATLVGYGGPAPATGKVSFLDTSFGNNALASAALGANTAGLGWLVSQTQSASPYLNSEVIGDFNGDGIPDLALLGGNNTYNDPPFSVTVLFGKGDGTFTSGPTTQAPESAVIVGMIAGDFNDDGKTDIVLLTSFTADPSGSTVITLVGNGDGTFATSAASTVVLPPQDGGDVIQPAMVVADFNGDGKPDLGIVGNYIYGGVGILLGNGDGTFTATATNPQENRGLGMIGVGDFNGDGVPDLVVSDFFSPSNTTVLLGKGDGTFIATGASLSTDTFAESAVTGDFNGDGKIDLAIGFEGAVGVYLGKGDGSFIQAAGSPFSGSGVKLRVGDFNQDGKLDLAGIDSLGSGVQLLLGEGDGTFTAATTSLVGSLPASNATDLVSGDFNHDGRTDFSLVANGLSTASILLTEQTETATVTVNNIAPVGAGTHNVEASYAGDGNYPASVSTTVALTAGVAPPVISPASGTFTSAQSITITDTTPGSTIYYQSDGALLTNGLVKYSGPIPLEGSGKVYIQAYATATGYDQSQYVDATFTLDFPSAAATPVLSLAPGLYPNTQTLTISDTTPGATIYYSTNGTYPYTDSSVYSGPISVSTSEIVTAVALAPGYSQSGYAIAKYDIASSLTRYIYTIGGNITYGNTGDGGPATFAEMGRLEGVAVDSKGNVYFAESGFNVVRKIAVGTGIITTIAGTGVAGHTGDNGPATSAELWDPTALAVDPAGDVFVFETGDDVVRRIDATTGKITTFAGSPTATGSLGGPATNYQISGTSGLACDHLGNLYLVQEGNVLEVNASTDKITAIAGYDTNIFFDFLSGIAVDSNQNIYVSDPPNAKIDMISPTGVVTVFAGGGNGSPGGDGGPATKAVLNSPAGLAVDAAGNVYIADELDDAIREVNTSGIINTVAGVLYDPFSVGGDGSPATDTAIVVPQVIAADAAGDVFFADGASYRIREITAPTAPPTSPAAAPVLSLASGTYAGPQTLTISDSTPGTEVYVTLNGSVPTTAGQGYHGPIDITGSVTVQAVALAPGYLPSAPVSATYTVTQIPPAVMLTKAGNGKFGMLGVNGPATSAELGEPQALAFDAAGNVYIADPGNYLVWKVAAGTGVITIAAGTGNYGYSGDGGLATAAQMSGPFGVAVDKAGNLYIADTSNGSIRMVTAETGVITTIAGPGRSPVDIGDGGPATSAYLALPQGIVFDSAGNLYIADSQNNRIRKITAATGIITTVAGGVSTGTLGDGGPATAAVLYDPTDVALDSDGNLYISDYGNARIRKVTASTGVITTIAGNGTWGDIGDGSLATAAEVNVAEGIAVDNAGNVYLSNSPDTIREVDATTGIISTIAGDGYFGYGGDGGSATMAELFAPQGLALDATGKLYIADSENYRVREVTFTASAVPPTITLAPSASSITTAQSFTVNVTVSGGSASPVPTGSVTLSGGGYTSAITVVTNGMATITIPGGSLSAGSDNLTVTYTPDLASIGIYSTATQSATVLVTVPIGTAAATVTATPSASVITDSQNVTVNVTVAGGSGQPTPTGTVMLASGTYSAQLSLMSGAASFDIAAGTLNSGANTLTASYTGDATYAAATATTVVMVSPVTLSISTPSAVSPGDSATATATFTAGSTYSGTLNLKCALTRSPTGAQSLPTCSLNPASVTLAAGKSGSSTLTLATTAASTSALAHPLRPGLWGLGGGGAMLAAVLWIGVPSRRRRWMPLLVLLLLIAAAAEIGCGGSGKSGPTPITTPATTAGAYTFTVTGTDSADSNITVTSTVTLTVQ